LVIASSRSHALTRSRDGYGDYRRDRRWRAFDPYERLGGKSATGAVVDSDVLNPELLKGKKGGRIWPTMRLKDRIEAIVALDCEELRLTVSVKSIARV
jgi:hypothetical protein